VYQFVSQNFLSSSLIRFSPSESDSEVLLVFVSGLTDGQSCQAIDSFLRGVYINVGEILNSDWLKSYIYFPYTPTQPISKNVKKKRNQREPMFNIHEMATMWPIQTLGSFGLLNWKTSDQEKRCICMPLLQEWLVLKSWYLTTTTTFCHEFVRNISAINHVHQAYQNTFERGLKFQS
jgi:hypothetical protein